MPRQHDEAIKNLNDRQIEAYMCLRELRSNSRLSYKDTLEEVIRILGYEYKVISEEVAKGLIIAITTKLLGYSDRRDMILMSIGLIKGYGRLTITERRNKYKDDGKTQKGSDGVRKDEDICFADLIQRFDRELEEYGVGYMDEVFRYAEQTFALLFLLGKDEWRALLAGFHENDVTKLTHIFKREIKVGVIEYQVLDNIRKKVEGGEKTFNTWGRIYSDKYYLGDLYCAKYHDKHDLMLDVHVYNYHGIRNIVVNIKEAVEGGLMNVTLPCEWRELQELVEAHRLPVFNYTYFSDGAPDDQEVLKYLVNKGVLFYTTKLEGLEDLD